MITKIIEATNVNTFNHGKFIVARFEEHETSRPSIIHQEWASKQSRRERLIAETPLLQMIGKTGDEIWVLDLQTGEGVLVPGRWPQSELGRAVFVHSLLMKHSVWLCPLFEPFLVWLLGQDLSDVSKLPEVVRTLPEEASAFHGHRRLGLSVGCEVDAAILGVLAELPGGKAVRARIEQRLGRRLRATRRKPAAEGSPRRRRSGS